MKKARRSYTLIDCPKCGNPAQEKNVYKPFPHGWVGCKTCRVYIQWVNGGKMQAVSVWNRRGEDNKDAQQRLL